MIEKINRRLNDEKQHFPQTIEPFYVCLEEGSMFAEYSLAHLRTDSPEQPSSLATRSGEYPLGKTIFAAFFVFLPVHKNTPFC